MTVCPRSLLLGLLIVLYLQSCVEGQAGLAPERCCFRFYTKPIPVTEIIRYKITGADCEKPGVLFYTTKVRLCVVPSSRWVRRAMNKIDQQSFKGSTTTQPGVVQVPEDCCFTFVTSPIPVAEITEYKRTGAHCSKPGLIFTTSKKGRKCADPNIDWVKEALDTIDHRIFEDPAHAPEHCCFSVYTGSVPKALISGYKRTRADCPKPGVIFTSKKGAHLCADPTLDWVKEITGKN